MEDREYLTFRRNDGGGCTLTSLYFTVLKEANDIYFVFYAIIGEFVNETEFTELPIAIREEPKRKYVNQIAFIQCSHGWIDDLEVFEQSLNPGGPTQNPQRCGIGTVLTELCLIDPDINVRRRGNIAREILSGYPAEFSMVERDCQRLVGLWMAVDLEAAAYVYFTAAINMRYLLLLIEASDGSTRRTPGRKPDYLGQKINIYPTLVAKYKYDQDTGSILPCGTCDEICDAYGRRWFFCRGRL